MLGVFNGRNDMHRPCDGAAFWSGGQHASATAARAGGGLDCRSPRARYLWPNAGSPK